MTTTQYPKLQARKPIGGFVFLTVFQLCLLWWTYRTRRIQLVDLRVWFAAHEMVARRCRMPKKEVPDYTQKELHRLVGGVGGQHLRASLRRLAALGLLQWSRTTLTFATALSDLRGVEDLTDFHAMHDAVQNGFRRVPVPRKTVRLIAGGLRASVIAAMLGHMIRGLYYKQQQCLSGGWCKMSWIASVFRMDLRGLKAARQHLVAIGWLHILPTSQLLCNRWGAYTQVSLTWTSAALDGLEDEVLEGEAAAETLAEASTAPSAPVAPLQAASAVAPSAPALPADSAALRMPPSAELSTSQFPPLTELFTSQFPPPNKEYQKPFQDLNNQKPALQAAKPLPSASPAHRKPASGGPTSGVQGQERKNLEKPPRPLLAPPTLRHIVPEDLRQTDRLLALFEQAKGQRLIGTGDAYRLTFLGAAEHARIVGSTNPCGLFATMVRRQLWHHVTGTDEDAALRRLKTYTDGPTAPRKRAPLPRLGEPPELSRDAMIARHLQTELARAGFRGDPYPFLAREDASWSRERWEQALLELEQAKLAWKRANTPDRAGEMHTPSGVLRVLERAPAAGR